MTDTRTRLGLSSPEVPAGYRVVEREDGEAIECEWCGATAGLRPLGDCECGGAGDE